MLFWGVGDVFNPSSQAGLEGELWEHGSVSIFLGSVSDGFINQPTYKSPSQLANQRTN